MSTDLMPILGELDGATWVLIIIPFALLAFVAFLIAAVGYFSYRKMKSTPTTLMRDLQEGEVEIKARFKPVDRYWRVR